MLEQYLNNLLKNKNYNFSKMKIDYIREDDEFYVVYFAEKIESIGKQLIYRIKKSNGENEVVFLPDEKNFDFLDYFDNCNFVQIPEKLRSKYF